MAKVSRRPTIEKYTKEKPAHVPLDPDQRAILVILHKPSGWVVRTWGWTFNQVLAIMEWKRNEVCATFRRPFSASRGAVSMEQAAIFDQGLAKLNEEGG